MKIDMDMLHGVIIVMILIVWLIQIEGKRIVSARIDTLTKNMSDLTAAVDKAVGLLQSSAADAAAVDAANTAIEAEVTKLTAVLPTS